MKSTSRWKLSTRITALCAAVAVLLTVIAAAATLSAVHSRGQLNVVFNSIGPLRLDADELTIALLNQETAVRGYALDGTDAQLQPYRDGTSAERGLVADMLRLLHDQPALRDRVNNLEGQAAAWRSGVAEPVIARVAAGDQAGAQALNGDDARRQFDAIRSGLTGLRDAIVAQRDQAVQDARRNTDQIVQLLVAAALVVVLAGIGLAILLRYLVTRPLGRLVTDVQAVASGDYRHTVTADGSPELVRLGQGIEQMRRRIVAELAEVSDARAAAQSAYHQLEHQATELTRSNRDLEQFAYVASHDLQEPLRKVASFCQLLQRRYAGQLDERADQYIYFAVDGAQRMQRLINDLLAFSRIGRRTAGFTDVDLDAVVADTVSQLESSIERAGAEIIWRGPDAGDAQRLPVVKGEEPLLTALLANLIGNSIKFRRPGVAPKVRLSAQRVGDDWEISCQDNGIGIDAEFADKVFVIFQRLHAKDAYPGTGIGLAIAKKIVEYHGGRIWLDTSDEPGSLIRFTLPVAPGVATVSGAATASGAAAPPDAAPPADAAPPDAAPPADAAPPDAALPDAAPLDDAARAGSAPPVGVLPDGPRADGTAIPHDDSGQQARASAKETVR